MSALRLSFALCQFFLQRFWITIQTWDLPKSLPSADIRFRIRNVGAVHLGLKFRSPPAHPFNPLKPLRVTSAIDDDGLREALAVKLLDAAWSEGRGINSDSVIDEVASSIGLNGQGLLGKAHTVEIKERLRLQTEHAITAGVLGVPSFVVDGEVFWGHDRLGLLKEYLLGRLPTDKAKVDEILSHPRAADRSRK